MKKKLLALLLVAAAATAGSLVIAGCNKGESGGNAHTHNFVDGKCEICRKDYVPTED